jgi:hypothetical protein
MKDLFVIFSLVSLLLVSCMSTEYKDAGIRIATDSRLVAGMQFVNGWTVGEPYFNAYGVGVKEANILAEKGERDVTVLVAVYNLNDRIWLSRHWHSKIWQISVYQ